LSREYAKFGRKVYVEMIGLREIRTRKGYSQLKVAMDLNISREALSYYETGKRSPDINMLVKLSEYFDVSIDYLITGKEFSPKH
jgi:transcriptional regulator with XRE-family HTH domain